MIEVNANLRDLNDVDLTTNLPSNNDLLAYNSNTSKWVPIILSGKLEPQYVVKDAWSTTGSHNFSENMHNFYIKNTGTSDITFTINSITITVKASEEFEDVFDPFTSMSISGTSTFTANVSALKTGSSNPQYTVKDYFSGSSNVTRQYSGNVYGLVVSNDDATNSLTYTVNGITLTLPAGDVLERNFNSFTQFSINSSTPYRAYAKSSFQTVITGSTADTTPPVITASPNGGLFNSTQNVTLSSNKSAVIYYTTDGTTPTTSSSIYTIALSIPSTTKIKYFGKDTAGNVSTVQTTLYTIDTVVPVVTSSPVGGLFNAPQSVTLSANKTVTIYYSLDGTTPTTGSSVYSSALNITSTTTLKYFGKDTAGNSSSIQSSVYTIDTVAPNPVTLLTAGTITSSAIPISWTLSTSGDVANYEVAYSTDNFAMNTVIASAAVNAKSTSYTVTGLTANTAYTVRVVSIDGANNRSKAVTVNGTTLAMSNSTILVSDSFNRSDNTATMGSTDSANGGTTKTWTMYGTNVFGISTNQAYCVSGVISDGVFAGVDAGVSDASVTVTLSKMATYASLHARATSATSSLILQWKPNGYYLYTYLSGVYTTIGSTNAKIPASGDIVNITCNGTAVKVNINGVQYINSTSTFNQTSTIFGFGTAGNTVVRFDDFKIESV
ncbi:chitobiase/beta-hexosaminidase C-terminal domain-containing protein [Paenibacillus sp. GP183]|uniref:chitobiase/beta-hexosaminidase C-terminal domain-containing protein n=1 Tax=Paenibacillus sp. GP183 TaxID=1882751 RepID=UPI0008999D4B|nr:chitobiase/beta-hexosaminidase C-terminal domain-containing protein [Paenibacillus sp. GP183]SEC07154.1 Fibronectin type III domain-containing protein [Paenibacillus sp. GP183]